MIDNGTDGDLADMLGDTTADVRRIPSLLSLFSEQSSVSDDGGFGGSPCNYGTLFTTPKTAASRARLLSSVEEAGSERAMDGVLPTVQSALSVTGSARNFFRGDSLQKLGVKEVEENYDDFDTDEEGEIAIAAADAIAVPGDAATESALLLAPVPVATATASELVANNPLLYTSSFVKSMSEYAFRRDVLLQEIVEGDVRGVLNR